MTAPTPQPKPGKGRQVIVLAVLVVLLALCGGAVWFATRDAATNAKVGDCMQQTGTNTLKIVKCDSPDAGFKVVGRVEGKEQIESTISISSVCDQWQETTNTYWEGEQGKKGNVLCLAKLK
jgi:hypothetical protein